MNIIKFAVATLCPLLMTSQAFAYGPDQAKKELQEEQQNMFEPATPYGGPSVPSLAPCMKMGHPADCMSQKIDKNPKLKSAVAKLGINCQAVVSKNKTNCAGMANDGICALVHSKEAPANSECAKMAQQILAVSPNQQSAQLVPAAEAPKAADGAN